MTAGATIAAERPGAPPVRVFDASVILLDIEGTISPLAYVKDVLFPYAAARIRSYLAAHRWEPSTVKLLEDARALSGGDDPQHTLEEWQANDVKAPPLKTLQGYIWAEGYAHGAFASPLYPDALDALRRWRAERAPLYVYSSGSREAQALFFRHSAAGDLRSFFERFYDTTIGPKTAPASYLAIADDIGVPPADILFLSDNVAELDAAAEAGLRAAHVVKDATAPDPRWPSLRDFSQVRLRTAV